MLECLIECSRVIVALREAASMIKDDQFLQVIDCVVEQDLAAKKIDLAIKIKEIEILNSVNTFHLKILKKTF